MPRRMRVQFPGAIYHVMSRGDQRDDIFFDDVDRHDFIKTLAEACQKTSWQVHAFCLMRNHYHMVVETPNADLVAGMQWLQSTYTIRLNNRHALVGHVLSGRYKAQLIEGGGNGYLRTACDYVHLNPIRAKLLEPEDRLLGEHGIQQDTPLSRQEFERQMERRRLEEVDPEALEQFRQDWCVGSEGFRKEQLERMEASLGQNHAGQLRFETAQAKADRIVAEELQRLGWTSADLVHRAKKDPDKLAIAMRLRRETTLSIKAIAARVELGTYNTANARLHRAMQPGLTLQDSTQQTVGL